MKRSAKKEDTKLRRKLILVAMNAASCVGTHTYLNSIFGSLLNIESVRLAAVTPEKLAGAECILYTSEDVKDSLPCPVPEGIGELICVRTFNHTYLHRLFQIPPDSFVYLVNDTESTAYTVIGLLQNFGFSQYHFLPWYPGCGPASPEIHYAVTPGETQLVPEGISAVIDIGNRIPDISTVNEIIARFSLPARLADEITKHYIYHIVQTLRLSSLQLRRSLESQRLSQTIISNISDGLCLTDQNRMIQMANPSFSRILGLTAKNLGGRSLDVLLSDSGIVCDLSDSAELLVENSRRETIRLWLQQVGSSKEPQILVHASRRKKSLDNSETFRIPEEKKPEKRPLSPGGFFDFSHIITENPSVKQMIENARRISLSDFHVIIQGESGTEKEMLAQAIHRNSKRHRGPFASLSFPSVDESTVKRELLGWEEGFFPGMGREGQEGLLERVSTGTLFISNIQFMPLSIQALLLNTLETGCVTRLGGSRQIPTDFRIIASSSGDLFPLVAQGSFLGELFFSINSVSLSTIPLRQRKEDIFLLLDYFCRNVFNNPSLSAHTILSESVIRFLRDYSWPGNAQELNNLCKFFFCVYEKGPITLQSLPRYMLNQLEHVLPALELSERQVLSAVRRFPRAGRAALRDLLAEQGILLSEGKIRSVLQSLSAKGLITVHRTRGGCEITEEGIAALR